MYEIKYRSIKTNEEFTKTFWDIKDAETFINEINASNTFKLCAILNNSYMYD